MVNKNDSICCYCLKYIPRRELKTLVHPNDKINKYRFGHRYCDIIHKQNNRLVVPIDSGSNKM